MNIVYASDDHFVNPLIVSMCSLLAYHEKYLINFYIFSKNISFEKKQRIAKALSGYKNKTVSFIEVPSDIFIENLKLDRGSFSAYDRILVGRFLPEDIDRILYLDCDTLIQDSLYEFYFSEFSSTVIKAVADVFNVNYKYKLKIPKNSPMFNNGVMLINLVEWRKQKLESKLLSVMEESKGNLLQGDLGLINSVLYNNVEIVSPKYNLMTCFYDFSYKELMVFKKPNQYYSEEEIEEAKNNPVIRHFTTSFVSDRPWQKGSKVENVHNWQLYAVENNIKLVKSNRLNFSKKIVRLILKTPCRLLMLRLLGLIQLLIRPNI